MSSAIGRMGICAFAAATAAMPARAAVGDTLTTITNGITYTAVETEGGKATLVSVVNPSATAVKNMDIPAQIGDKDITVVGNGTDSVADLNRFRTIVFPAGLQKIAAKAFRMTYYPAGTQNAPKTSQIEGNISIPEGVTEIGDSAFHAAFGTPNNSTPIFSSISLPSTLATMGEAAFANNANLYTVTITAGVPKIAKKAFYNTAVGQNSDGSYQQVAIPGSVKEIGDSAFALCTHLRYPALQEGLEKIGAWAFSGCDVYGDFTSLPASVKDIGDYAFFRNSHLTSFTFPEGSRVERLGNSIWGIDQNDAAFIFSNEISAILHGRLEYIDMRAVQPSVLAGIESYDRARLLGTGQSAANQPFRDMIWNVMVYLPAGVSNIAEADNCNYVVGDSCAWFSLQDFFNYEFPHSFTAAKVSYNDTGRSDRRKFAGTTYYTIFLPYAAKLPAGMTAYELDYRKAAGTDSYYVFTAAECDTIEANKPYVLLVDNRRDTLHMPDMENVYVAASDTAGKIQSTAYNTVIGSSTTYEDVIGPYDIIRLQGSQAMQEGQEWRFVGTTEHIRYHETNKQKLLGLYKSASGRNEWRRIWTDYSQLLFGYGHAFRGFIQYTGEGEPTYAKPFVFILEETPGTATGIGRAKDAERMPSGIYTVDGRYMGGDTDGLQPGVYIVKGKKILKRGE